MLLPTYDIANRATNPRINIDALANKGSFIFSSVTAIRIHIFFMKNMLKKRVG